VALPLELRCTLGFVANLAAVAASRDGHGSSV
jgi:hypothetical protein